MRTRHLLLTLIAVAAPLASLAQETAADNVFRVDGDRSWLRVLAWPDGPLKRFGHHHVISHHGISGTVRVPADPLETSVVLEIGVGEFVVDDPEMRALEGEEFEGEVPQKDVDGTKANMLGERLLNAEAYPRIRIESTAIEGELPEVAIVATVSVGGATQTVRFPATVELGDDALVARGEFEVTHGELGLAPFTAMGGALSVRDLMVFKYEITGERSVAGD